MSTTPSRTFTPTPSIPLPYQFGSTCSFYVITLIRLTSSVQRAYAITYSYWWMSVSYKRRTVAPYPPADSSYARYHSTTARRRLPSITSHYPHRLRTAFTFQASIPRSLRLGGDTSNTTTSSYKPSTASLYHHPRMQPLLTQPSTDVHPHINHVYPPNPTNSTLTSHQPFSYAHRLSRLTDDQMDISTPD